MVVLTSISVIAGASENARFNFPSGICYCKKQRTYFIADMHNHRVCSLNEETGETSPITHIVKLNNGTIELDKPLAITCGLDECLYVTDAGHNNVYKKVKNQNYWSIAVEENNSFIFNLPSAISIDEVDNLYVIDFLNNRVLSAKKNLGWINLFGSSDYGYIDGDLTHVKINKPFGIFYWKNRLYFSDTSNNVIRYEDISTQKIDTINPIGLQGGLESPIAVSISPEGNIYVAEHRRLFMINIKDNTLNLLIDSNIWKNLKDKFNLKERLTNIGALVVPKENTVILIDTIKGLIYKIEHQSN